jgi:hypothetical protein
MFKINDHVMLDNAGTTVTGRVIGTYTTFRARQIFNGYVVELDPKYQGSITTISGDTHAFVSQLVVDASNLKLADRSSSFEDDGA